MEPERQLQLADILREHREYLETRLDDIAARGVPLTDFDVRLIKDAATTRIADVEQHLRYDSYRRIERRTVGVFYLRTPPRLRRLLSRLRGLVRPKIGRLRHHPARALTVPASYAKIQPPHAAPTVSIVTPSFAQGRYLERTLYSVLAQGYPTLEYFVQDGGSTDETLEILERRDGQLTGWASEPDGGQADAINRGFSRTTGELMGWLNSDDILLPGALAYVARYFAEHPEVDVVYGNRILIDEDDGEIGVWVLPKHDDRALTLADFVPQETLFWRRSIWEAVGGRLDPTFGYALDWDLLLRFREAGATIVHLPRFLGAFRVHAEQKTSAEDALGDRECASLRIRVHGHHVRVEEIVKGLRPYMRRHVLAHSWQRFVDRMPHERMRVKTLPPVPRGGMAALAPEKKTGDDVPRPALEPSTATGTTASPRPPVAAKGGRDRSYTTDSEASAG
jgi:glycosyltransferase involved in cell wall biosynthesis